MAKRYSSVQELIKDISDDKEFNKSLEQEIAAKQISRNLSALRNGKNLSQEDLARKLGVNKRKISKIENSYDVEISVDDILRYSKALGMHVEISFFEGQPMLVDRVKYHYFRIKKMMDELVDMSKGDAEMELAAANFSKEAFFNISMGLIECMKRAERKEGKKEAPLLVSAPIDMSEQMAVTQPN